MPVKVKISFYLLHLHSRVFVWCLLSRCDVKLVFILYKHRLPVVSPDRYNVAICCWYSMLSLYYHSRISVICVFGVVTNVAFVAVYEDVRVMKYQFLDQRYICCTSKTTGRILTKSTVYYICLSRTSHVT